MEDNEEEKKSIGLSSTMFKAAASKKANGV